MKHFVISGFYGFGNAGDEAILQAVMECLREAAAARGEEVSFTVLSADPAATAARFGVAAVGRTALWPILCALRRADAFISGGGGLLQDVTGRFSVAYYLGLVLLARLLGKPAVLYAQGFGPVRRPVNRLLVRLVVNRAALVSVRDETSRQELQRLGVKGPITVTVDPVFALDVPASSPAASFIAALTPEARRIGVSVRPWPAGGHFLPALAAAVDCLARELAAHIILIPMYPDQDLPACRELAGLLKSKAHLLEEELLPRELLWLFSRLDLVLGMRLHALVFAAIAGVPMAGIGYDPKVDALLARLGLVPAGRPGELDAARLAGEALEQWQKREEAKRRLAERSAAFAAEARRFARQVLELFPATPKKAPAPANLVNSGKGEGRP